MKIRNFAFVAALLLTLSFSSCSNENESLNKGDDDVVTRVSFSIAIPKGEPVTYATTHDVDEYGIESLWLYEYNADGKLLSLPVNIKSKLTGTGPEYTYEKDILGKDKGTRRFIFVANEVAPSDIVIGTTLDALKSKIATKVLAAKASSKTLFNYLNYVSRLPMTGAAVQAGSELIAISGAPASVSVEMTRIVSRIDINNQVPNMTITSLKLKNVNSHSYIFLNNDYDVPTDNTKVSGITPFTALPTKFDFNKKMPKAFYLYEGHQTTKEDALQLEVTGTLGGEPVFYSIPFWKDGAEVVVKRNHIYYVTLGDGKTTVAPNTIVSFSIDDKPWEESTINEIFNLISAAHSGSGTWDAPTRTLSVDNKAYSDIVFDFTAKLKNGVVLTPTVVDTPAWITANIVGTKLTVTVEANAATGAEDRNAVIEIAADTSTPTKYIINVKQTK